MNLHQLQYFDRLSRVLHYQRAAEELGISQPALSRSITTLENELGVDLFERRGRGIVLSRYGVTFASHISAAMLELETGIARVKELADPDKVSLNLGVNYVLANTFLAKAMRAYLERVHNPSFYFQLYQGNTPRILQNIKDGICDLGFCSFMEDEPEIRFYPLIKRRMSVLVPSDHPLTLAASVRLEDVLAYPLILSVDRTFYLESLFRGRGLHPTVACRTGEDRTIAELVAQGFGLAILPFDPKLLFGGISFIFLDEADLYRTYYVAESVRRPPAKPAEGLKKFMLEYAKKLDSDEEGEDLPAMPGSEKGGGRV